MYIPYFHLFIFKCFNFYFWLHHTVQGSYFPKQRSNPWPLYWNRRLKSTGLSEKSPISVLKCSSFNEMIVKIDGGCFPNASVKTEFGTYFQMPEFGKKFDCLENLEIWKPLNSWRLIKWGVWKAARMVDASERKHGERRLSGERTEPEPGASLDLLQAPIQCGFTRTEVSVGSLLQRK